MIWWKFILVLLFAFGINFTYALYVRKITVQKYFHAAILGEVVTILMLCNIRETVNNFWYIIPVVIGGFLGTWWNQKWN